MVPFGRMAGEPMQLSSADFVFKQAILKGFWGSKVSAAMPPEIKARLIGELLRLVASGDLKLPTEAIFGLDQISEAINTSRAPGKLGKSFSSPEKMGV